MAATVSTRQSFFRRNSCSVLGSGSSSDTACNNSSTDICPYCRSFRGDLNDETGRKFTIMCSQQKQQSSSSSSSTSAATTHKHHSSSCSRGSLSSPDTHQLTISSLTQLVILQTQCSQLENCPVSAPSSSSSSVRHFKCDLCQCAKNFTNVTETRKSSSTSTSTTIRANHSSSFDGWRAFRLVILGILVILPTSTMSSPVRSQSRSPSPHSSDHHSHHSSPHRGNDKPMKWINPCRIPKSLPAQPSEIVMPSQSDEEIFQNIVTQAKKAEVQARQFFADFREECFGKTGHDFQQLHYDWLKDVAEKVGKNLGEPVGQTRLDSLEVEDILKTMYRGLQKLAVGLEQVVLDQAFHGGSFYQHFHEAEFQLKYVLCEFQIAMMEKNIQYEDVTRDIMDKHFVNLEDKTWRNVRDFSIFRDYLNTLEFIKESFEHFWKQAKQES